jgi:hypothetical protein
MKILINSFNNKYYGTHDMAPIADIRRSPWGQWKIIGNGKSKSAEVIGNVNTNQERNIWMQ